MLRVDKEEKKEYTNNREMQIIKKTERICYCVSTLSFLLQQYEMSHKFKWKVLKKEQKIVIIKNDGKKWMKGGERRLGFCNRNLRGSITTEFQQQQQQQHRRQQKLSENEKPN